MSNRRRLTRPLLDLASARAARENLACPDCDSDVSVNRRTHEVTVAHDDGCPARAALTRQGRTSQVALVRRPGQSAEAFADDVSALTKAVTSQRNELWPGSTGIRVSFDSAYTDLDLGGAR